MPAASPLILYLSPSCPLPADAGGRQRTNLLMRAMSSFGELRTVYVSDARGVDDAALAASIERFGPAERVEPFLPVELPPFRWARPLAPSLMTRLAHNTVPRRAGYRVCHRVARAVSKVLGGRRPDVIVSRYLMPGAQSGLLGAGTPAVLDVDDLETSVYEAKLAAQTSAIGRSVAKRHLTQMREILGELHPRFAHLWIVSESDRAAVRHDSVSVLPNLPYAFADGVPDALGAPTDNHTVMVIASWNHGPNVSGLARFLHSVWPGVRERVPEAILRVIGGGMSHERREAWSRCEGVEIIGRVDDLVGEYEKASICVSPVYEGGGTKIKVLESLAYGRAIVVSGHSHRGYEDVLQDGDALLAPDSDEAFADACVQLLQDPARREALAHRGHALVREHFSFAAFESVVHAGLRSSIRRGSP